ncbi:MAG TPA: PAS domain S-box protein, partial [Geobacteraceae bacterium]|nr:PAS domain S-box protein [Geobacteraceae bacterium]
WAEETAWDAGKAWFVCLIDFSERRRNEQEQRKLQRAILESPSIVLITDVKGVIEFVNPKFTSVTGYTFAEVVGKNPRILKSGKVPPEVYKELWETILAGREWRGEMINRKKNGELYWESAAIMPVRDMEEKITNFIAVTEDITERKRMEEALRESEDKFSKAFQAVPALLSISRLADGRYIEVNEAFEKTLGYPREEVVGHPAQQLGIWENPGNRDRLVRLLREGIKVRDFETRLRGKTGEVIVGALSGEIINIKGEECLLALTRDITRIKQAEEKLLKSEQMLSEAQRMAHIGSWEWNIGADKLAASAELPRIFGVPPEVLDATYAGILKMVHPDDREKYEGDIRAAIAEKTSYDNYHRIIRPDGTVRILHSQGTVTVDEAGTPALLIGTCQDVTERRQAEEALRETEQKLRNIVEHSTNLFYMHTADHILTYVSPQSQQFFDCEPEEAMVRWTELITDNPLNREAIEATQRAIDTGERQPSYQLECIGRKGRKIWVEVNETPIVENGRAVAIVGSLTDITERKQAEEALQESEERYRSLIELAPDAVIIHQDGWFAYANAAALQLFGAATFEQLQGRNILELIHPDERDTVRARMNQIRGGEKVPSREFRVLRLDGGEVPVEAAGVLIEYRGKPGVQAIIRNISERKQADVALRESEHRFRTLAAAAYEGIVITEHGRILDVNEQLTQILGYERSELVGVKVSDLLPPKEHDRVLANILLGHESQIEHEMLCRDGSRRIVEARGKTIDQHGRRLRITAIRDVTERRRAEEKIEMLNTDLMARAAELEAAYQEMEAFGYTVSHDLRKPLTVINGYSQMILETCGINLDEQCAGFLREICEGTLRMSRLIDSLLDLSRLTRGELRRETVDLCGMARTLAAELSLPEPERRVTFRIGDGIKVSADKGLLRVVLTNLLGNAWKYTAGKGEAVIEIGVTDVAGEPACFVRDNGPGFDMAHADKLFVPFQRLPGAHEFEGHGIGLATVQRIIKRHGGRVWAEGEPGKGATFYFTLPADKPAPAT